VRRGVERIDGTLVEIREALAHGRVSAAVPDNNLRFLKFSTPARGRVRVNFQRNAILRLAHRSKEARYVRRIQSVYQNAI
jgi:hypothetical protein